MRDALSTWSLAPVVAALQAWRGVQLFAVTDIAWAAQTRLCSRYRRLAARRVHHNKIVVAIARELCGFVWAIARGVTPAPLHVPS